MKRLLITVLIVIGLGVCASVPSFLSVSGQNPNKFRRTNEKKIRDQYIVVLKDDADPTIHAWNLLKKMAR
jgi:hypothetical protein